MTILGLGDQRMVVGFLPMTHIYLIQYIQTGCGGPTHPLTQWVPGLAAPEVSSFLYFSIYPITGTT